MGVVPLVGLVLHMRGRNGDAARFLFRCLVDLIIGGERGTAFLGQHLGDGGRQRGLAVIDVTDGPDVAMRLRPLEFFLSHAGSPSFNTKTNSSRNRTGPWAL
jgi:hypothetical protein